MSSEPRPQPAAEVLAFLLDVGTQMIAIGAETYRVEETLERMGRALGAERVDVFATPPGLWLGVTVAGTQITGLRRVKLRSFNLAPLAELNALSRDIAHGSLSLDKGWERLQLIRTAGSRTMALDLAAGALGAAAFTAMLGGNSGGILLGAVLGVIIGVLRRVLRRQFVDRFIASFCGGLVCAVIGQAGPFVGSSAQTVAAGGLVILVPGLQFTNAVRDILAGDLLSAAALGIETMALALGLAGGVAAGLALHL